MSWRGPGVSAFCAEKAQQFLGKGRDIITCWLNLRRWYCSPFVVWFFSFIGLRTQLSSYSRHSIPSTKHHLILEGTLWPQIHNPIRA